MVFDIYGYAYRRESKSSFARVQIYFEIFLEIKYVVSMNLQNPLFRSVYV